MAVKDKGVSPYLLRPRRTLDEAIRQIEAHRAAFRPDKAGEREPAKQDGAGEPLRYGGMRR